MLDDLSTVQFVVVYLLIVGATCAGIRALLIGGRWCLAWIDADADRRVARRIQSEADLAISADPARPRVASTRPYAPRSPVVRDHASMGRALASARDPKNAA